MDTEPQWSEKRVSVSFTTGKPSKWYQIFASRYYYCAPPSADVKWHDVPGKDDIHPLKETVINVRIEKGSSVNLTIFYTTQKIRVQGLSVEQWLEWDYPRLQSVYNIAPEDEEGIHCACQDVFDTPSLEERFLPWERRPIPPTDDDDVFNEQFIVWETVNDMVDNVVLNTTNSSTPS